MRTLAMLVMGNALAWGQADGVKTIAAQVDRHYNHLSSLKADFVETYSGNGVSRTESGTLWLKKPGKMLWSYTAPQSKVFVTDGKTAWFYVPGEQQARKAPLKKLDDLRSPLRYLLGGTKLEKEFRGLKLVDSGADGAVLEGIPNGMEDRVTNVRLTVKGSEIVDIRIEQTDGAVTEFKFAGLENDAVIADGRFKPDVPSGTQWIEMQDLSPQ